MSPKQPQPPSYHSAAPNNIPHDNPAQETSPSHPCPNPAGASPPYTTAYLPPHSQYSTPQDKVPDGGVVLAQAVQKQHRTIASDLPSGTYPYTPAYPTSTTAIATVNVNTVPAPLFQPIHTCPDTYNPYNPHGTTQTSTHPSFPAPSPLSTTNTPAYPLTSESLSLLNSITSPHDHLSHFLSTTSTNDPWSSMTYHARPPRD